MLDYVLIYLAVGVVLVLSFQKPIRDKVLILQMTNQGGRFFTLRLIGFVLFIGGLMASIWPFYALVVYSIWRGNRPMTMEEIERWDARMEERFPGRRAERMKNRKPVRFVTPIHADDECDQGKEQS